MLPKKGKTFPGGTNPYAVAIARALTRGLGDSHRAVKTAMRWTGAGERTVKNWFAGVSGPNGQHLIALVRHSDDVLEVFLQLAGREETVVAKKLLDARSKVAEMLVLIQSLMDDRAPKSKRDLLP